VAREYLKRGASLTLVARRKAKLEELARGNERRCHLVEADLSDHQHSADWVDGSVAAVVAKYSFPAQFRVGCGGRKRRCGSHDRRDEGAGRRSPATRAQAASGGPGPSPSLGQSRRAQVRADGGFTHRMFSNGGGNLAVRSPSGR
jgi:NAD(P)-dependent dehydrogenase (short-subunit alcohol dehydrogenase family)